eukprot:470550-Hanusia_phi.AAC.12
MERGEGERRARAGREKGGMRERGGREEGGAVKDLDSLSRGREVPAQSPGTLCPEGAGGGVC